MDLPDPPSRPVQPNAPTDLAAIQRLPKMNELLTRLSELPENILDDEEAGRLAGGPRLVIAMRAVKARTGKGLVDFLANNKRGLEDLPPDQATDILSFLAVPEERKSPQTINTDLEVDVTIVAPSNIRLPGELRGGLPVEGMTSSDEQSSPDAISEYEKGLLNDRSKITGVVLDPETQEIIGYRTSHADGISRLVDREGEFVLDAGAPLGVESEGLGPLDYTPSPIGIAKGVGKAAAGVTGKLIVKGALKKGVASGGKVTLAAILKMRNVARAIAKSGGRKIARLAGVVLKRPTFKALRAGAPIDKRLLEIALQHRTQLMKAGEDFGTHNVAVVKLIVDGTPTILSARNIVGGLHSEVRLIKQIERMIANKKAVQVLQIYSERIPCSSCMNITKRFPKADIFYSVADALKETTGSNAKSLKVVYGLIP